jgi:hypothetical protein
MLAPDHLQGMDSNAPTILSPKPLRGGIDSPKPPSRTTESPKLRWDALRRHVLQNNRPLIGDSPTSSETAGSRRSPSPFGRSSTPKPSRFPRLGLRQVVENAREVVADDMRRFIEELEKACMEARFVDLTRPSKRDREPSQGTIGSYLSLHSSGTGSTSTLPTIGAPKPISRQSSAFRPSVTALLRTLERYEFSPVHRPQTLPIENRVLSTLLMPFLSPGVVDSERELAFRAFKIIVIIWRGDANEVSYFAHIVQS